MRTSRFLSLTAVALLSANVATAQDVTLASAESTTDSVTATETAPAKKKVTRSMLQKRIEIQNIRPMDQRGLNMFEAPKAESLPYDGFKLAFGAAFSQTFQGIQHENTADSIPTSATVATNANRLATIGNGANLATANLYVDAQLAPGIRVALTSYLSSRHHQETWVKDGYLQIDGSPIDFEPLNKLFEYVTIRAGHMEQNYGDAHFRRSDNGNGIFNPFVGNLLVDAMTTEIGGEVYVRTGPWMVMGAVTTGENKGNVTQRNLNAPAFYGKAGFDKQLSTDLRTRLTASWYRSSSTPSFSLYGGDRGGSRYYTVMENTASSTTSQFTSGLFNPGFSNEASTIQINPFVKFRGLEVFGVIEQGKGRKFAESADDKRELKHYAADVVYRFGPSEQFYAGYRYNTVTADLLYGTGASAFREEVGINKNAFGAGWFITPSLLTKVEYVSQKYNDFPSTDIRNGGKFNGLMIEGAVAF